MIVTKGLFRKLLAGAAAAGGLCLASVAAHGQATPFENDVGVAIDRGIEYLATAGAFNNPSSAGDAAGLPMLALLEKRASGDINDPPQGYDGANVTDKARLRTAAAYILDRVNETGFYAYRDGNFMFALAVYALTRRARQGRGRHAGRRRCGLPDHQAGNGHAGRSHAGQPAAGTRVRE